MGSGSLVWASRRFWVNLAALALVLTLNYVWLARYTALLDESDALLALNGGLLLAAAGWAVSQVLKLVKKDWAEAITDGVAHFLNTSRVYLVLLAFLAVEWLVSLFAGGLELKDPSGTGGSLKVAIMERGGEPAVDKDWDPWDAKKPYHDGPWFMCPWRARVATIFVQGVPRKQMKVRPWWLAGESHRLEYPRGFLRPVVLITAEQQLVRYADQACKKQMPYTLVVTIGNDRYGPVNYDGHSVWVGCGESDRLPVPAGVRIDWDDDADGLLAGKVLRPQGYNEFQVEIPVGSSVSAAVFQPGEAAPRTRPVAVTAFQPTGLDRQTQLLVLTLPPPPL